MTTEDSRWRVRLTAAAESDFSNILRWTSERFGESQARRYAETLKAALRTLKKGPLVPGSRERNEIGASLMTLHVARGGRRGRHLVVYRIASLAVPPRIDVLRLLHDSMDLSRHTDWEERDEG